VARSSRTYARDARGRFASTPGGGSRRPAGGLPKRQPRKAGSPPPKRRGLVTQRAAVRRSAAKLRGKDPADQSLSGTLSRRAQKGAVTRASNRLQAAQQGGRQRVRPGATQGVIRPIKSKGSASSKAKSLRERAAKLEARGNGLMGGGRRDGATVNVPISSRARSGAIDAGLRGLELTRKAATLRNRADRIEERAAQSAAKAKREAAKPKRTRTPESMRLSRAKQIERRRGWSLNPAGSWGRPESIDRMAANAARTQQRALAFYAAESKARRSRRPRRPR
jgi:hypothetical protein